MNDHVLADRYLLLERIGEGGMGSVYRALDKHTGQDVAVKMLHHQLCEREQSRRRFSREIKAASILDHPGIVKIIDHGEEERPYFVMELLTGCSLRKYVRKFKPDIDQVLQLTVELCDALEHAHSRGIVHRDLKPDNIFVNHLGHIKVLDFGLARLTSIPELSVLTREGTALGTCSYMAPEQATGSEADHRADLYAVGVILYEFLCGMTPFSADEPASVLYMQVHQEPEPPCEVNPDLPCEVEALILWLMNKNPKHRPQSALLLKEKILQLIALLQKGAVHKKNQAFPLPLREQPKIPAPNETAKAYEPVPNVEPAAERPMVGGAYLRPNPANKPNPPHSPQEKTQDPGKWIHQPYLPIKNRNNDNSEFLQNPKPQQADYAASDSSEIVTAVLSLSLYKFERVCSDMSTLEISTIADAINSEFAITLQANTGKLLEFKGYSIKAMFTGLDASLRAVQSAHRIRLKMDFLRKRFNLSKEICVSAGVFTDNAMPDRLNDLISAASRLEVISNGYTNETIINEESRDQNMECTPLRTIFVKNRSKPVFVYRMLFLR